ncbi:MAG: SurA N-terminal domain-containing protein [Alistipes sp.]|nr:SurA N-terminal domain-containing protein [Alistipes sp.]
MASLNTLRTRFGVVLSIIIAFALLAFILSLKTEMGFSGNDPKVGVIDGTKIKYSEYFELYNDVKTQTNASEADEQQMDQLAEMAWEGLISRHVYLPGFEKMGIRVTDAERAGLINGDYYSSVMASLFTDPRTGLYDVEAVGEFLNRAGTDPQLQYLWASVVSRAMQERQASKYGALVDAGVYANSLEVNQAVATSGKTFGGRWTGKRFSEMPDSLYTVSDAEIRAYYDSHKARFEQRPLRTLSYVVFEVAASDEDRAALEQTVREVGDAFAAAEDVRAFARNNRYGKVSDNYIAPGQLLGDQGEILAAGNQYGPVLQNDNWVMSRVVEFKSAPDSIGLRHIVLPYTQNDLADSLMTLLRGGADFAALAERYSLAQTAANGGDAGVMPFSAFPDEFSAPLATAKKGDLLKIAAGDAVQLLQIYRADNASKHMRIATITYPVEPSSATRRSIHNAASLFAVDGRGSIDAFNEAANAAAVTPRVATLSQGDCTLRGVDNSRELVRWAYGAKVGEMSEIFNTGSDYVVAVVTAIDDNEHVALKNVEENIRKILVRNKKRDDLAARMQGAGTTLEEVAQSLGTVGSDIFPFDGLRYNSFIVRNMGIEPRVIGAVATTERTGVLSEPVKGENGVYVFEVTEIENEGGQSAAEEKVRLEAEAQGVVARQLAPAIVELAEIEDLRGKYF